MSGSAPKEPDVDEIRRQAIERLRQLERKAAPRKKPVPQVSPELWPGGPGVDTGDIRLARLIKERLRRKREYA